MLIYWRVSVKEYEEIVYVISKNDYALRSFDAGNSKVLLEKHGITVAEADFSQLLVVILSIPINITHWRCFDQKTIP